MLSILTGEEERVLTPEEEVALWWDVPLEVVVTETWDPEDGSEELSENAEQCIPFHHCHSGPTIV